VKDLDLLKKPPFKSKKNGKQWGLAENNSN
jgi:hypothetical protein